MAECPTKQMSSYQRLKYEFEKLLEDFNAEHAQSMIYEKALWEIAHMKGAQVVEAPAIALQALYENNEAK